MAKRTRQAGHCKAALALALLLAGSLAGCQNARDPGTTGSLSLASADPRQGVDGQARRYDANPSDPAAALDYARTLRGLGRTAQALAVLQGAALRNPNHPALLSAYGKVLADAGRLKEASTVLANAHRPERPDWRILNVQGAVADQMGQFDTAQRFYVAALRIVPGEPSVLANQGLSFALAKRLDEAERVLGEAARDARADARVRRNLALVMGLRGRMGEADALLRRDMPAAEAELALAEIRGMAGQPNSGKPIRGGEPGRAVASVVPSSVATATPARTAETPSVAAMGSTPPQLRHAAIPDL